MLRDYSATRSVKNSSQQKTISADSTNSAFDSETRKIFAFLVAFRKKRAEVFSNGYFSDPAWDILLDLANAESNGELICITQLGSDNSYPTATIIRHVNNLVKDGFIVRKKDGYDRRKSLVILSELGRLCLIKCAKIEMKRIGVFLKDNNANKN